MSVYGPDSGENPGVFTTTGVLLVILVGVGVFWLLYTALASPSTTAPLLPSPSTPAPEAGLLLSATTTFIGI